jgi:glucuronokinase
LLINANFDLRRKVCRVSQGNVEMVDTARSVGATSKFAGSGGAIVGTWRKDEAMYRELEKALTRNGVAIIKPKIRPPRPPSDSEPLQ